MDVFDMLQRQIDNMRPELSNLKDQKEDLKNQLIKMESKIRRILKINKLISMSIFGLNVLNVLLKSLGYYDLVTSVITILIINSIGILILAIKE